MPRLRNTTPKYRKHRASGQALVTLDGRDDPMALVPADASMIGWLPSGCKTGDVCPSRRRTA